ncbi:MAG: helix-turn-helix transcriptional regulator [Pseudazoarcus pumilus]|nr:helix-turn-helix transcriptional regulator [Pseudazoarcus pumilus]
MHRIQFNYVLAESRGPAQIRNPLIDLLHAVEDNGSISAAARQLGFSYRHVWGELKRWEDELGHGLIVWEKGQPARLTEFGTKLLWAERQAQARLQAQIDNLRADLERAYAVAFDDSTHVLSFHASHDDALSALREQARSQKLHLDIRFTGSVDAIRALNEGRCMMAGFHTRLHPARGSLAYRTYRPMLKPGLHKIIGFARRTQGLIVAPGNPLQLTGLKDLARGKVRFANRALGTGTRLLLDELLDEQGIAAASIRDFDSAEPSHTAVAQAVAAGQADAGLGIEAAARARGLDFVPVVEEQYHLACLKSALAESGIEALLKLLRSEAWQTTLQGLAGYAPEHCGEVLAMSGVLPWWRYRTQKHPAT